MGPAVQAGAGASFPSDATPATPPAPILRDPREAAADVGTLMELAVFGAMAVRWRNGGPVPSADAAVFWGAAAADLTGEFAPDMPRLVNSAALRIAAKVARLLMAPLVGAVQRAAAAQSPSSEAAK